MPRQHGHRLLAWVTASVILAISLGAVVVSGAEPAAGCAATAASSIQESSQFTPVEQRLTQPFDPPITVVGTAGTIVPEGVRVSAIDGLPPQWAVVSSHGAVYQYFLATALDTLTVSEFRAAGGIELDRDPMDNGGDFSAYVLDSLGERATKVEVGSYTGALVWADPLINGLRPHYLYWSDATWNWALMADRTPEELVNLARDLVCSGKLDA